MLIRVRQTLVVGCLLTGVLVGCGGASEPTSDPSTTQAVDASWFALTLVTATSAPPCDDESAPSTDSSTCYLLGDQILDASGVVAAEAIEHEPLDDCPPGEVICHLTMSPTSVTSQPARTAWAVRLTLSPDALRAFNAAARRCFVRANDCPLGQLAIVIDGQVVSAPQIQQQAFEADSIQIADGQAEDDARSLAARLS